MGKILSLVPKSRSSAKVKVRYQGHSFKKKIAVSEALVFQKHILFFFFFSPTAGGVATLDFLALETKPGVLLKIVSNTSAELVAEALERRDIEKFCGHLVSMMISFKGVTNLPKALLAGHVKTALLQLHASDPESETPGL